MTVKLGKIMKEQKTSMQDEEKIEFRELLNIIIHRKWFITITTAIFAVGTLIYVTNLPNIYKSEVVLAPANESSSLNIQGQLGGLAALAGVNIGGKGVGKTTLALEVLKSREFLGNFIEDNNLYIEIMAAKGWNRQTNSLVIDKDIYNEDLKKWVREVQEPFTPKPSLLEAIDEFGKIINISENEKTGIVTISVSHYSPYIAKSIVEKIVKAINENIRHKDLDEAEKSIEYLNKRIGVTNISDMRELLYSLIEEQSKTVMLANIRNEYVFKTIDPPVVTEKKIRPQRALIVIMSIIFGLFLSIFIVSFQYYNNKFKV